MGSSFRTDIQGLRGIAIVLVVALLLNAPFITGGFVGVDVFFALSGYLITALLIQEYERDGRINLSHFYARRLRRLLPASMLVTLCAIVAGLLLYSLFEQTSFSSTALAAATYTSNWQLLRDSLDYFAAEANHNLSAALCTCLKNTLCQSSPFTTIRVVYSSFCKSWRG